MEKRVPGPWTILIHTLSMTPMVWRISMRWLPGCAASQLLHTCSLAEYGKLKKVKNISVINFPLLLTPKHSSY